MAAQEDAREERFLGICRAAVGARGRPAAASGLAGDRQRRTRAGLRFLEATAAGSGEGRRWETKRCDSADAGVEAYLDGPGRPARVRGKKTDGAALHEQGVAGTR